MLRVETLQWVEEEKGEEVKGGELVITNLKRNGKRKAEKPQWAV